MSNSKANKQYPIGFTSVDNRIYYIQDRLSPSAFSIFMRIHRMSEGYDGEYKSLSNTYFQKVCNISKNTVTKAVKELEKLGIIKTQRRSRSNTLYCVNMSNLSNIYDSLVNNDSQDVTECGTTIQPTDSQEVCSTKQNLLKQNNTKENSINPNIPFDEFWDLYDYKKNKADCNNKWLLMTDEERQLTMDNLALYIKSTPDKTFRKYPINYLNNEMWNDEVIIPSGKEIAHNNNGVFSASHKEFEPVFSAKDSCSSNYTKDDEECNLEALGLSSGKTTGNINTKDCNNDSSKDCTNNSNTLDTNELNNKSINKINTHEDILSRASRTHWSELKSKGLLKKKVNPDALSSNTDADSKVNEFLARYGSKGYCKDIS